MKERPIIFDGESVQAILEGCKTQTRRVIKPQPNTIRWCPIQNSRRYDGWEDEHGKPYLCPYGKPGDRLWVRETWFADPPYDGTWDECGFSDGIIENFSVLPERFKSPEFVLYKSTWKGVDLRWRSTIHMPRWASRINLEVVNIRVERVQDISEQDAVAEGWLGGNGWPGGEAARFTVTRLKHSASGLQAQEWFTRRWNLINAKRGYGWNTNPLVWVIEFKILEVSK